jgi:hypothetical protein
MEKTASASEAPEEQPGRNESTTEGGLRGAFTVLGWCVSLNIARETDFILLEF